MTRYVGRVAVAALFAFAPIALATVGGPVAPHAFAHGEMGDHANVYNEALMAEGRPEADIEKDQLRKPDEVLAFLGLEPGMSVMDIWAAGGYYTEVASHVVGPDGMVVMQNHRAYQNYAKDEIAARLKDGRLANVAEYVMDNDTLDFSGLQVDMVLFVLGFHDIYYADPNGNWPTADEDKVLNAIVAAIKPGGVLGIVDHRAPAGSSPETGNTTHRIAQDVVVERLRARGLVLEAESDVLANHEDDLTISMYDPSVRGRTDRMVLRFRKPATSGM